MQNEQIATDEFRKRIKEATEAISKSSKDLYRQLEKNEKNSSTLDKKI